MHETAISHIPKTATASTTPHLLSPCTFYRIGWPISILFGNHRCRGTAKDQGVACLASCTPWWKDMVKGYLGAAIVARTCLQAGRPAGSQPADPRAVQHQTHRTAFRKHPAHAQVPNQTFCCRIRCCLVLISQGSLSLMHYQCQYIGTIV